MVSFKLRPVYCRATYSLYLSRVRMFGFQSRSGGSGEGHIFYPCLESKLNRPLHSVVLAMCLNFAARKDAVFRKQGSVAPQEQNLGYLWVYQLEHLSTVQITLVPRIYM